MLIYSANAPKPVTEIRFFHQPFPKMSDTFKNTLHLRTSAVRKAIHELEKKSKKICESKIKRMKTVHEEKT